MKFHVLTRKACMEDVQKWGKGLCFPWLKERPQLQKISSYFVKSIDYRYWGMGAPDIRARIDM